jgi:copper(I)-binding protein
MLTRRRIAIGLAIGAISSLLAACGGGPSVISVRDAWARPAVAAPSDATPTNGGAAALMLGSGNSVVYLTVANTGDGKDTLLDIRSDAAARVQLHRTEIRDNVASMRGVTSVEIPAHGEVRFDPGSYHLVLANVRHTLTPGDTVDLTLTFKGMGQVRVRARVRER